MCSYFRKEGCSALLTVLKSKTCTRLTSFQKQGMTTGSCSQDIYLVHNLLFPAENHAIFDVLFQLRGMTYTATFPVEQRNAVHGVLFQAYRSAVHGVLFPTKRTAVHSMLLLAYRAHALLYAAYCAR